MNISQMSESQTCSWGSGRFFGERTWNGQKQREIEDQIVLHSRAYQEPNC